LSIIPVNRNCPTSRSAERGFLSLRPVYPHTPSPFTINEIPERRTEVEFPRALARGKKSHQIKMGIYPQQCRAIQAIVISETVFIFTQNYLLPGEKIWIVYNDPLDSSIITLATIMDRLRRSGISPN